MGGIVGGVMRRTLLFISVVLTMAVISSAKAIDQIDYASMCDETKIVEGESIKIPPLLPASLSSESKMVDLDLDNDNEVDAKLLCFDGAEIFNPIIKMDPLNNTITITSPTEGQQFIIHNMKINLGTDGVLKIGSNIILDKLNIVGLVSFVAGMVVLVLTSFW